MHEAVIDEETREDLRRRLRAERAALSPERVRAASHAVCAHAKSLVAGRVTAFYAATQNEIDPAALVSCAARALYPRVDGDALIFHDSSALAPGRFAIREPAVETPIVDDFEVALVPGVAFSLDGQRLGFGRGYYDRALAARPRALRVGLCHSLQLVPRLQGRDGDEPLDWIVTPEGAVRTGARKETL